MLDELSLTYALTQLQHSSIRTCLSRLFLDTTESFFFLFFGKISSPKFLCIESVVVLLSSVKIQAWTCSRKERKEEKGARVSTYLTGCIGFCIRYVCKWVGIIVD